MVAGEQLMNDVYDLLRDRLPELPPDDPYRTLLLGVLPQFGRVLGRSPLIPVPVGREL